MKTSFQNRWPSDRSTSIIIVLTLLGIVALPVFAAYWPIERARWLLAAADNALEQSKEDGDAWSQKARTSLEKAIDSYPDIENTLEFARTSFRMHPDELDRALKLVLSTNPRGQAHAADVLAELRCEILDFDAAYKILVAGYPVPAARSAIERNQLAYYSALANRELEPALVEIEKALADSKNASYLDTKAWVLFRLKRLDEALLAIDQAVEALGRELKETAFKPVVKAAIEDLMSGKEPFQKRPLQDRSNPLASYNRDFAKFLKSIVVIRYHRGEILEGLGRIEEADQEFEWVQNRGFHDFDQLY